MDPFPKIVTKPEAKAKIKMKVYELKIEKMDDGGAQATYNIPQDLFESLIQNNAITRKPEWDIEAKNGDKNSIYVLNNNYRIELSENITNLIGYKPIKPINFIIVVGNNNKPQLRRSYFETRENDIAFDFNWFVQLFYKNQMDTVVEYCVDNNRKVITIDSKTQDNSKYEQYETTQFEDLEVLEALEKNNIFAKQQKIFYGAPGTGKSYKINEYIKSLTKNNYNESRVFRTTLHPEYSYYDFVGTIQPVIKINNQNPDENSVVYEFVPGIFTEALEKALSQENLDHDVFLVIEEMSRGNVAAIFGDIFQLLDRTDEFESEFKINNKNILYHLNKKGISFADMKIFLPKNFNILGTVNTSDQNVYVMDTAFKRRFKFEYVNVTPVQENGEYLNNNVIKIGSKSVNWCDFIVSLNEYIVEDLGLQEDKQIGQFFIKSTNDPNENSEMFKFKVLYYLWHDVHLFSSIGGNRKKLFRDDIKSFSKLIEKYDENLDIFNNELSEKF